jgi:hypothetical protein
MYFLIGKQQLETPTYWPTDRNKPPDLVDICVTEGVPHDFAVAKSGFNLFSERSPFLITLTADVLN